MTYDDYAKSMKDYFAKNPYAQPADYNDALAARWKYNIETGQSWLNTLTPQQRAEYDALHQKAVDANKKKANTGAIIALGAPLLAAGAGAMLGGYGAMGGAGGGAGGGAMGGFSAAMDSQLASAALGITGADAAAAASVPAWASGAAGGGAGAGWASDLLKTIGGGGGTTPNDLLKLIGGNGGGGMNRANMFGAGGLGMVGLAAIQALQNKNKMPAIPDYMKLANMTGASANPNQTNAQGDQLTYVVDPVTGQRTQTVKYGAQNQAAYDKQQQMMMALRNKTMAPQAPPPPMSTYDPSGFQSVNPNALWG